MPRDVPTYTICAGPGVAHSHKQFGGFMGFIANLILEHKVVAVVVLLPPLIGLILANNPVMWFAVVTALSAAAANVRYWYYHERLLCIRDRDCAIGTVISLPNANFDGDIKFNLMLAPFRQRDFVGHLGSHLERNRDLLSNDQSFDDPPFHTPQSHPTLPPLLPTVENPVQKFFDLHTYMPALQSKDPDDPDADSFLYKQMLIGAIDRVLADPVKSFQHRFLRKDPALIPDGTPLSNAMPPDFDPTPGLWESANAVSNIRKDNPYMKKKADGLNPLFRFHNSLLVAFLHCEIEGYYVALLIDNLILALWAWYFASLIFSYLGPAGLFVALLIAGFLFFLKWFIDEATGNDGYAEPPDVDWDDPDTPDLDNAAQREGDVVVAYGSWIMDTEHYNYFEIHPVRAYYIITRNAQGTGPVLEEDNLEQLESSNENFDPSQITTRRAEEICAMVTNGEEGTPDIVIFRSASAALSCGMVTQYAGAQQIV